VGVPAPARPGRVVAARCGGSAVGVVSVVVSVVVSAAAHGCAATASSTVGRTGGLSVVVDGRSVAAGPAAFTVRVGARDSARVVSLRGVGEIVVLDDACRFARLEPGGALRVWRHDGGCAAARDGRLCFRAVGFVDDADRVRATVDGCAEQNELFLDRIDGAAAETGLGPRTLVERCVDVAAAAPSELRVVAIAVDGNDQPWRGLRVRRDGDGLGVCFLSKKTGRYRIEVVIEDPGPRAFVLQGDVDDF